MPTPLNPELVRQIRGEMQFNDTVDLVEIWQTDDPAAWTAEGLEAVRSLLEERLGPIPPQAQSAGWTAGLVLRAQRHLERAQAWEARGKYDKALAECQAAVRLAPRLAAAHLQLGLMLDAQDQLLEAMAAYREALRLDPNLAEARENLTEAQQEWSGRDNPDRPPAKAAPAVAAAGDPLLSGEYVVAGDLPAEMYLSETSRVLRGWPGYRTQPRHSGYDYLETYYEQAHMQGVLLRQLFTGKLRTGSVIGLLMLTFVGTLAQLPLFLGGALLVSGDPGGLVLIVVLSLFWVPGLFLLWNVMRTALAWGAEERD